MDLELLGSSHSPTSASGVWSCRVHPQLWKPPKPGHTGVSRDFFGLSCPVFPLLSTGCLGTAGIQMRTHPQDPSPRTMCPKCLPLMGTAATMRLVQRETLRPRDGQQPAKVSQQWPLYQREKKQRGVETHRRSKPCLSVPSTAVDSTGEPAVPPRELDGYLDSLFDPVLACGDAVGLQRDVCRWQTQ